MSPGGPVYRPQAIPLEVSAPAPFDVQVPDVLRARLRARPERGPHHGREFGLMRDHGKRLALVGASRSGEAPHGCRLVPSSDGRDVHCHRPGNEHLVRMVDRAASMLDRRLIDWRTYTIRCGCLYGYPKTAIRSFVRRRWWHFA